MLYHPTFTPAWPMVLGEHHFAIFTKKLDRLAQVLRPGERVAHRRAARRQYVVHAVDRVLSYAKNPQLGEVKVHLRGSLAFRDELKHQGNAINNPLLTRSLNLVGWRNQSYAAA